MCVDEKRKMWWWWSRKNMEIMHGFKYSKIVKEENDDVGVSRRVWRSVKRVAAGRLIWRRRRKLVAAVVMVRRVVLWASVQLKRRRRTSCRISDAARRRRSNNRGQQVSLNLNYDMFKYCKNFDDGKWQEEEVDFYARRSFSYRFVDMHACGSRFSADLN